LRVYDRENALDRKAFGRMKRRDLPLSLLLAAMFAPPVFGHHSFAMYDREKTVTLSGTVKEFTWTSPHVLIRVLAGNTRDPMVWFIEGASPTVLSRGGWTGTSLKPGDRVSLGIHPSKSGALEGLLADEQQVVINGQPAKGLLSLNPAAAE
jgi:Family of unknown function (DUF6152)